MPPIILTISVEGEPEASIAALRRIVGLKDIPVDDSLTAPSESSGKETRVHLDANTAATADIMPRYRQLWENGGQPQTSFGVMPELARPAQWNKQLCDELVSHMTDGAKRLVGALAEAGVDGMKRDALTTKLGIQMDTIRTTQVSIGHSLRRVQRANGNILLPRPVGFHKNIDTYMLHPAFRAALEDAP